MNILIRKICTEKRWIQAKEIQGIEPTQNFFSLNIIAILTQP